METLDFWYQQIKDVRKLKINEAKELYVSYVKENNEVLKQRYLDNIILGTMYIPLSYIRRCKLYMLKSALYDVDDFVNSFNEVWIEEIKNGALLETCAYSEIFTTTFFNKVYKKLGGEEIQINEYFYMSQDTFIKLFFYFVFLKRKNKFTYQLFLEKYMILTNTDIEYFNEHYIVTKILIFFNTLYDILNLDYVDIEKSKVKKFIKLIVAIGLEDDVSDCYI